MSWRSDKKRHSLSGSGVKTRKNISVVSYVSPTCGACKRLDPHLSALERRGIPVKRVDITERKHLSGIRYTPTVDVYRGKKRIDRIVGYSPDIEKRIEGLTSPKSKRKKPKRDKLRKYVFNTKSNESIQKTGCIGCSTAHLATVSGSLNEAIRFAMAGGIKHPEVVRRLHIALEEIAIMERIDLSPEAIQNSPPKEQKLIRKFQPKIRQLRQHISEIKTVDDLERTATEARHLSEEIYKARLYL